MDTLNTILIILGLATAGSIVYEDTNMRSADADKLLNQQFIRILKRFFVLCLIASTRLKAIPLWLTYVLSIISMIAFVKIVVIDGLAIDEKRNNEKERE